MQTAMSSEGSTLIANASLFAAPIVVGALSGALSGAGGRNQSQYSEQLRRRVPGSPPPSVFGPVWTLLYTLMGVAIVLIVGAIRAQTAPGASVTQSITKNPLFVAAIGLFALQLFINFMWSIIYFRWQNAKVALWAIVALDALVAVTTVLFFKIKPLAGALMIPYAAWLAYATYLNVKIVQIFGQKE